MNEGASYLAAAITASVAVVLWMASRVVEFSLEQRKLRNEREKFVRALYAEIDFNTHDMEVFIEFSASIGAVTKKIHEDPEFIPHITDQRHREVYKSQISLLHHAGDDYIADVVTFYGVMDKIGTEIQGVYLSSYKTISADGRVSVIDDIVGCAFECAAIGQAILAEMERTYPAYRLSRKKRKAPDKQSDADLRIRLEKLALDLDRARSTH